MPAEVALRHVRASKAFYAVLKTYILESAGVSRGIRRGTCLEASVGVPRIYKIVAPGDRRVQNSRAKVSAEGPHGKRDGEGRGDGDGADAYDSSPLADMASVAGSQGYTRYQC